MSMEDIIGAAMMDIIGRRGAELVVGGDDDLESLFSGDSPTVVTGAAQGGGGQQLLKSLVAKHAAALADRKPTKAREYVIGFPTTSVTNGTSSDVTTNPQIPFRPRRLTVPSDIAGSFLINDIKIGQASQFVAKGPVPARTFSELAVGIDLHLDTAQVSQDITMNVQNTGNAPLDFNASMIGTTVL